MNFENHKVYTDFNEGLNAEISKKTSELFKLISYSQMLIYQYDLEKMFESQPKIKAKIQSYFIEKYKELNAF